MPIWRWMATSIDENKSKGKEWTSEAKTNIRPHHHCKQTNNSHNSTALHSQWDGAKKTCSFCYCRACKGGRYWTSPQKLAPWTEERVKEHHSALRDTCSPCAILWGMVALCNYLGEWQLNWEAWKNAGRGVGGGGQSFVQSLSANYWCSPPSCVINYVSS